MDSNQLLKRIGAPFQFLNRNSTHETIKRFTPLSPVSINISWPNPEVDSGRCHNAQLQHCPASRTDRCRTRRLPAQQAGWIDNWLANWLAGEPTRGRATQTQEVLLPDAAAKTISMLANSKQREAQDSGVGFTKKQKQKTPTTLKTV